MNAGGGGTEGAGIGVIQWSSTPAAKWLFTVSQRYQHLLDKSTPHVLHRWIFLFSIGVIYAIRVYFVEGFYIITYGLGIYILQLLIAFLSPQVDPEIQELTEDGPSLPSRANDEFRPFVRRLPEFKFWYPLSLSLFLPLFSCLYIIDQGSIFIGIPQWAFILVYFFVFLAFRLNSITSLNLIEGNKDAKMRRSWDWS